MDLLNKLIDKKVKSDEYARTMFELGRQFGHIILDRVNSSDTKITLACTVEDADNIGKGIMTVLEENKKEIFLTVFWNKRLTSNKDNGISVAPIIREFHEEGYTNSPILIIIKSIISSSCVVRTNLCQVNRGI